MQAHLWLSDRCFECSIDRIERSADGWVVKTRARRYFRFDAASIRLLRRLMQLDAAALADPAHAAESNFLQRRLIPLGIYLPLDAAAMPRPDGRTGSGGAMRWQRQLLGARQVRPLAAALAPFFSPWLFGPWMALCLWVHISQGLGSAATIGYHDLIAVSPDELLLLVAVAVLRGLLHELGHAAACWRLTRSVGAIGFGVFMSTPVLYCDVSDIHLLPRRSKALVGLAGCAMDVAFLALLLALGSAQPAVMKVYWLSVVAVLLNLLPFYRNDGFWVLNDLAGSDDLVRQSVAACRVGKARPHEWALVGFTAACAAAIVALGCCFAVEFGPQQVAEAVHAPPSVSALVLAAVTAVQYAGLVFGLSAGIKTGRKLLTGGRRGQRPRLAAPRPVD